MIQNWLEFVCVASFPESLYQAPLHNMANNSTSNGFYESEECPYLEEVAWRDEFLLTEGIYNHLVGLRYSAKRNETKRNEMKRNETKRN